jgi:hypothetical protein
MKKMKIDEIMMMRDMDMNMVLSYYWLGFPYIIGWGLFPYYWLGGYFLIFTFLLLELLLLSEGMKKIRIDEIC